MQYIFWFSIFMIFYAYLGYPACLWLLAQIKNNPVKKKNITPHVTLVISVYNEEKVLAEKIKNSLALDYPKNILQIAIISDGSTDRSNDIILAFAEQDERILPCIMPTNKGKTACLNDVVPGFQGEIVLFSDANAFYEKNLVKKTVKSFADKNIGFVTGSTRYFSSLANEGIEATNLYSNLEKHVKTLESRIGSCVGADGAVFAIRKLLYKPPPPYGMNDFEIPLSIIKQGYRGVLDPRVYCREEAASNMQGELRRHIRITSRTIRAIFSHAELLNPFKYPIFSFQLISHKLFRFFVPLFMLVMLFSNIILVVKGGHLYQVFLILQMIFYGGAVMGTAVPAKFKLGRLFAICNSFVYINIAILLGWLSYFSGETYGTWIPVRK